MPAHAVLTAVSAQVFSLLFVPLDGLILFISKVDINSRESTQDKIKEVEHIIEELGEWEGTDPATGFQLVKTPEGRVLRIADLVDDDSSKRDRVSAALKDPAQKNNKDHVDIIIALGMAKLVGPYSVWIGSHACKDIVYWTTPLHGIN